MADLIVKCDGCGQPGKRRAGVAVPDHWFFIESIVAHKKNTCHIVYACSESCRDGLWRQGVGPRVDETGTDRMRARESK